MSWFKKKGQKPEVPAQPAEENAVDYPHFPEADRFKFVQTTGIIHEQTLKSKPTTFFKDAMHRFAMNKSSLVASVILGIIMMMAIIVPFADTSDIETPLAEAAYLAPKWFDNTNGFLDGTDYHKDVLIDYKTGLPADGTLYQEKDIVGGKSSIKTYDTYSSIASNYGRGGDLWLTAEKKGTTGGIMTGELVVTAAHQYSLALAFDQDQMAAQAHPASWGLSILCDFDYSKAYATTVTARDFVGAYDDVTLSDILANVRTNEAYITAGSPARFNAKVVLNLAAPSSDDRTSLYLKSLALNDETSADADISAYSFADGNEAMLRYATDNAKYAYRWPISGNGNHYVFDALVTYGSFRYDQYDHVYGYRTNMIVGQSVVNTYIANGWMSFDWSTFDAKPSGTYTITSDMYQILSDKCPILEVLSLKKSSWNGTTAISLITNLTGYRYYGYNSMPHFLFGTDQNGRDYFKKLFTGLRTSLLLGVLTAVINITFGLIWGAISGYFGGWTDMLMERFTEILGGVPWIVVMTLVILHLGSTFWSFLLALCLTGWMGISGETRSQFYRYKGREYVLASRTLGANDWRLIFRHILPNGIGPVITGAVLMIPGVIFDEAMVSYLGLGLQGNNSFGVALSEAQSDIQYHPYLIICGSIIISLLMISFNLFGNGLRDAFNPSLKGNDNG
jgi:oligopeptide transport system permease protein